MRTYASVAYSRSCQTRKTQMLTAGCFFTLLRDNPCILGILSFAQRLQWLLEGQNAIRVLEADAPARSILKIRADLYLRDVKHTSRGTTARIRRKMKNAQYTTSLRVCIHDARSKLLAEYI